MKMDLFIGKKLYYINNLVQCVFCKIVELTESEHCDSQIMIENEFGKRFKVKRKQITEMGKIVYCEEDIQKGQYLKCKCGSMRFFYNSESTQLRCQDCDSQYQKDEFELLDKVDKIESMVEKIPEVLN